MTFKISNSQFTYLNEELRKESLELFSHLKSSTQKDGFVLLDIDEDTATAIRDWAGDKLQRSGFDENYEPTKEGTILEDLMDVLYR